MQVLVTFKGSTVSFTFQGKLAISPDISSKGLRYAAPMHSNVPHSVSEGGLEHMVLRGTKESKLVGWEGCVAERSQTLAPSAF